MLKLTRERKIIVDFGTAENLPYLDKSFYYVDFITSICFFENPLMSLREANCEVKDKGDLIIALIDRESSLG